MLLVLMTTCLMCRNNGITLWSYLIMSDELGSALISFVSLRFQDCRHPLSPWSGRTILGAVIQLLHQKCRQKNDNFEFSCMSRRDRVRFRNCLDLHTHCCATVSASNFQVLICSGWRVSTLESSTRFSAGPALMCLRFRGCPVLPRFELSVSAWYHKTHVLLRARRPLLVAAASSVRHKFQNYMQ